MRTAEKYLKPIIRWAKNEESLRALILLGSLARRGGGDPLSDLDLALFVRDPVDFLQGEAWWQAFGSVWLINRETVAPANSLVVFYEDGPEVDFTIYPTAALEEMQRNLPDHVEPGYRVLVDKDKLARNLPKPSGKIAPPPPPTPIALQNNLTTTWFLAYQCAKALRRGALWRAKHHDWALKQNLLTMMGWYARLVLGQEDFTTYQGKDLKSWIDPDSYTGLMTCFGRFYPADSWRALEETLQLFNRLARAVAEHLDFPYPEEQAERLRTTIQEMKQP
jgi:aminoglycoside 6-adenylyltransferase